MNTPGLVSVEIMFGLVPQYDMSGLVPDEIMFVLVPQYDKSGLVLGQIDGYRIWVDHIVLSPKEVSSYPSMLEGIVPNMRCG